MAESNNPKTQDPKPIKPGNLNGSYSGQSSHYPNPPETVNPDAASLRDQWKFAIRQYSKWYSHAWGTAIFAGGVFFALGWFIKGGNPIPSKGSSDSSTKLEGSSSNSDQTVEK